MFSVFIFYYFAFYFKTYTYDFLKTSFSFCLGKSSQVDMLHMVLNFVSTKVSNDFPIRPLPMFRVVKMFELYPLGEGAW